MACFDIISMNDFSKEQITAVLDTIEEVKQGLHDEQLFMKKYGKPVRELLQGIHVANLFLENSTRTNYSFRAAVMMAGGNVDGFPSPEYTSLAKGETWADTAAMFAGWGYDALVMRSTVEGLPRWTKEFLCQNHAHLQQQGIRQKPVPMVVNGGDGKHQHPTQCILDLFTMRELCRKHGQELEGMHLALLNDLAHGRTNASLMSIAHHFNITLHLAYPPRFGPQAGQREALQRNNVTVCDHGQDFQGAMRHSFIAYHSRPQKERVGKGEDLITIKAIGQINRQVYEQLGENAPYLMHPLPVDAETFEEISHDMETHPKNVTKIQSANGLPVRIALLAMGLGRLPLSWNSSPKEKVLMHILELPLPSREKILDKPRSGYIEEDGVVLDHLPPSVGRRLEGVLGFEKETLPLVSAYNLLSKIPKDIIKIHCPYSFTLQQLEAIALLAPHCTLSFIEQGTVTRKIRPVIGNYIEGRITCGNTSCVSNVRKEHATPKHWVNEDFALTCIYCEEKDTLQKAYAENRFMYL